MSNIARATLKIIPTASLSCWSKHYSPKLNVLAKKISLKANGTASIVVHPRFSENLCPQDNMERYNPYLFRQMLEKDYPTYLTGIKMHITSTKDMLFVLAESRRIIETTKWLLTLDRKSPIFIVATKDIDPTPIFKINYYPHSSWHLFGSILKDLSINNVNLQGELAYMEKAKPNGCVFSTKLMLLPHVKVAVDHRLTYPGLFAK